MFAADRGEVGEAGVGGLSHSLPFAVSQDVDLVERCALNSIPGQLDALGGVAQAGDLGGSQAGEVDCGVGQAFVVLADPDVIPERTLTLIIYISQAGAAGERSPIDADHTLRDHNTGQAGAVEECLRTNAGHAFGDHNAGQADAGLEHTATNAGHAVRDLNTDQVGTAVERIHINAGHAVGDHNAGQAGAAAECIRTNAGHTLRDQNAGQTGAIGERGSTNAGNALRKHDINQTGAAIERILKNAGDAIRNDNMSQVGAALERIRTNVGHAGLDHNIGDRLQVLFPGGGFAVKIGHIAGAGNGQDTVIQLPGQVIAAGTGDDAAMERGVGQRAVAVVNLQVVPIRGFACVINICQIIAAVECIGADIFQRDRKRDGLQIDTAVEGVICNSGKALGDLNGHQVYAVLKGRFINTDSGFGQLYFRQLSTAGKDAFADQIGVVRNFDLIQVAAVRKGVGPNFFQSLGQVDRGQIRTSIEGSSADYYHTFGNGIGSGKHSRRHDKIGFVLIEQNAAGIAAVVFVGLVHPNGVEVAAVAERPNVDLLNAGRNADLGKAVAVAEYAIKYLSHTVGNVDRDQIGTAAEGILADADYRVGDLNCLQIGAIPECTAGNTGNAVRNFDGGQIRAAVKGVGADVGNAILDHNMVDVGEVVVPGCDLVIRALAVAVIIAHGAGTEDGQHTAVGQRPPAVITAGAGSDLTVDGYTIGVVIAAADAGVGGIAVGFGGRGSDHGFVFVSQGRNYGVVHAVLADLAEDAAGVAGVGAGGSLVLCGVAGMDDVNANNRGEGVAVIGVTAVRVECDLHSVAGDGHRQAGGFVTGISADGLAVTIIQVDVVPTLLGVGILAEG